VGASWQKDLAEARRGEAGGVEAVALEILGDRTERRLIYTVGIVAEAQLIGRVSAFFAYSKSGVRRGIRGT
jgi:hypothetical protein